MGFRSCFRVSGGINILLQPRSEIATEVGEVTFSVVAQSTASISYQWQVKETDTGQNPQWTNIPGEDGDTLTISITDAALDGYSYRCVLTTHSQTVESDPALLTVSLAANPPVITMHPVNQSVTDGDIVAFSVEATGETPFTYQWQKDTGGGWVNVTGAVEATLAFTAATADNGNLYRVGVTNSAGGPVYSDPASLVVVASVSTPTAPSGLTDTAVSAGSVTLEWTDNATNEDEYVVQRKPTSGPSWATIATISANSVSYTDTTVTAGASYGYRVGARNTAGTGWSSEHTVVTSASADVPTVTIDPRSHDIRENEYALLGIRADGPGLSYQWEQNTGSGWGNVSGETLPVLVTGALTTANDGIQYRCKVTNANGTAYSNAATIGVNAHTPVYPLDDLSGCVAAASLYKLKSSQTYCCTVKRSSDGTTQDIGFVGQLPDIRAAMTFCGDGDGIITAFKSFTTEADITPVADENAPYLIRDGLPVVAGNFLPAAKFASNFDPDFDEVLQHRMSVALAGTVSADDFQVCMVGQARTPIDNQHGVTWWRVTGTANASHESNKSVNTGTKAKVSDARGDIAQVETFDPFFSTRTWGMLSGKTVVMNGYRVVADETVTNSGDTYDTFYIGNSAGDGSMAGDLAAIVFYTGLSEAQLTTLQQKMSQVVPRSGPTTTPTTSRLEKSTWWQETLYNWWDSLASTDFDVTPSTLSYDGTYSTSAEIRARYIALCTDTPSFYPGNDVWSHSGDYCTDDGGAEDVQLTLTQHCYIAQNSSGSTYSASSTIPIGRSGSATGRTIGYLEYDLTGIAGSASDAIFKLTASSGGGSSATHFVGVKLYFDTAFDETTATWDTPPTSIEEEEWEEIEGISDDSYSGTYGVVFNFRIEQNGKGDIPVELVNAVNAGISGGATKMLVKLYDVSNIWNGSDPDKATVFDMATNPPIFTLKYKRGFEVRDGLHIPNQNYDKKHHESNGNTAGQLVALDLPLTPSGQGNPFYGHTGMANRGLALSVYYLINQEKALNEGGNSPRMHFTGKRVRPCAINYYYLKDYLPQDVQIAYEMALGECMDYLSFLRCYNVTTNMDTETAETAGICAAACRQNVWVRNRAIRCMANMPFGKPTGSLTNTHPDRRVIWPAGYIGEFDGPDPSYNGRSLYHLTAALAWVHWDAEAVALYQPLIDLMWRWQAFQYLPDGNGDHESPRAHCCRTAEGASQSQMRDRATRGLTGGYYSDYGLPEAVSKLPANDAAMAAACVSAISAINGGRQEKAWISAAGYNQAVYSGIPNISDVTPAFWSVDTPPVLPPDWYDTLDALRAATAASYPCDQSATFSESQGGTLKEFWAVKDTDGSRDFGFYVSAVDHSIRYKGWYGGQMDSFWIDDMGVVFNVTHKAAGGSSPSDSPNEDTRKISAIDKWPAHHFFGEWRDEIIARTGSGTGAVVEVTGDKTAFYHANRWYRISQPASANKEYGIVQFTAVTYNSGTGRTEITLGTTAGGTSPTSVAVGYLINHRYSSATCGGSENAPGESAGVEGRTFSTFLLDDGGDPRVESEVYLGPHPYVGATLGADGVLPAGQVTLKKVFRKLSDGVSVDHIVTADATAQTYYRSDCKVGFGLLLTNPWQVENEIQYWNASSSGWGFLSLGTVNTQYLRIRRTISGTDRYCYVWLDSAHDVSLGEVYTADYQVDKDLRALRIHLHATAGTPELWPASESVQVDIRTTAPPVGTAELTSTLLSYPEDGAIVADGCVFAARWTTTWGVAGAGTHELQFYNGADWVDSSATITETSPEVFEALVYPLPSYATMWRVKATNGLWQVTHSPQRTISLRTPTLILEDNFTDSDGVLLSDHTPDSGTWLSNTKSVLSECEINGNALRQLTGAAVTNIITDGTAGSVGKQHVVCEVTIPSTVSTATAIRGPQAQVFSRYDSNNSLGICLSYNDVTGGRGFLLTSLAADDIGEGTETSYHYTDDGSDVANFPHKDDVLRFEVWCCGAAVVTGRVYNVTDATEICTLAFFGHSQNSANRRGIGLRWSNEEPALKAHYCKCYTWL